MPPLWQYLSPLSYADESIPAPKGDGLRTPVAFSLQTSRFQGTAGRSHDRHRGPGQATPCRWAKAIPRCGSTSRVCERAWTPDPVAFSLQTGRFQGTTKGTMIGLCGPPYRPGRRCARGEGHAPVRAVLVTSAKADEPIFVPKGRRPRTTKAFSSCKCAPFEGTADGTVGDIWLPLARCCCLRRSVPRETQRRRRARVMPGQSGRH
jgi:hypothetical protein